MKRLLQCLHRDQNGHYTFIALVGAIPFLFLFVQIINLGSASLDNARAQNAADAMAQSHAAWTARSLNIVSMNNVTMSQAAVVGANSAALHGAITELTVRSTVSLASVGVNYNRACVPLIRLSKIPYVGAAFAAMAALCTAEHAAASAPAIASIKKAWDIHRDYNPAHGVKTANRTIRTLSAMNTRIIERAPEEIGRQLEELARIHGLQAWYVHRDCTKQGVICGQAEGRQGLPLPLEQSNLAVPEMCMLALGSDNPMLSLLGGLPGLGDLRSVLGYDTFDQRSIPSQSGPDTWGGSRQYRYVPDNIVSETSISQYLHGYDDFYRRNRILGLFAGVYLPAPNVFVDLVDFFNDAGGDTPTGILSDRASAQSEMNETRGVFSEVDLDSVDENGNPVFTEEDRRAIEAARNVGSGLGIGENSSGSSGPPYAKMVSPQVAAVHFGRQEKPSERKNNFFRRLMLEWGLLCTSDIALGISQNPGSVSGGNSFSSGVNGFARRLANFGLEPVETPELYWLKERQLGGVVGRLLGRNDMETPNDYKPLVVVYREPAVRLGGRLASFRERGVYAMAEAITLSSGGTDLYSQLWGGRLTRVTQVTELDSFVSAMRQLSSTDFDNLRSSYLEALQRLGTTSEKIGDIHVH